MEKDKEILLIKSSDITEDSMSDLINQVKEFEFDKGVIPIELVFKAPSGKYVLVYSIKKVFPNTRSLSFEFPKGKKIDETKYKIEFEPELLQRLTSLMTNLQLISY